MPISNKLTRTLPLVSLLALAPAIVVMQAAPPREPVVGVVDVIRVIEQYPKYIELSKQLAAMRNDYGSGIDALTKQLDEMRVSIPLMVAGSEDRIDKEHEYSQLARHHDHLGKKLAARLKQVDLRNTLTVYEDLDYAIARVAEKRGITLVLTKQNVPRANPSVAELDEITLQRYVQGYDRRQVWHASKELDLTDDLIKYLMTPLPERTKPSTPKK